LRKYADYRKTSEIEMLERRLLLSTVTFNGNTLFFTGDPYSSNSISASLSPDGQTITANIDGNSQTFSNASVASIRITGGGAGDTIVIDPNIKALLYVWAGDGNDYISCGGGNSTVFGNGGIDTIIGNGGQNVFHGGSGNDSIIGGSGASVLYGDDGNDTLIGGSGSDTISGGPGNNVTQGPAGDTVVNTTDSQSVPTTFQTGALNAVITLKSTDTLYAGESFQVNGLNSGLGVGSPNTASYHWNFGDAGSEYNDLDGWNAAHLYETPGQYIATLTVTNEAGQTSTAREPVYVASADAMRTIYVAPWGNDSNDGLSQSDPIQSINEVNQLLGNNTRVLFASGQTYRMEGPINIVADKHVEIGSYGSGAQPILLWDGVDTGYNEMIVTQPGTFNVGINNLTFDSIYFVGDDLPTAVKFTGYDFAVSDCTFLHVTDAVDLSGNPVGTLIQDCQAPDPRALSAYFVWVAGSNTVILGNYVANSAREHVIRMVGAKQTLIAYNNLSNISGAAWGDNQDGVKGVLTIQIGSYAYVDHNILSGPSSVGPLATTQVSSLINNFAGTFNYCVFDSNTINNGPFEFEPSGFHTMLRNNVIYADNSSAIIIQAYDELYGRIVNDAEILGNTVINHGTAGNFLDMVNTAQNTVLADNLYVANNLQVGAYQTAPVFIGDTSLESFSVISHNIWSAASTPSGTANPAGASNYVATAWWNPAGYLTANAWNNMSPVNGDLFETVHINPDDSPVFNGSGVNYGVAIPGLFADGNGHARPAGGLTVGAIQY
jgi:hypothetical protein